MINQEELKSFIHRSINFFGDKFYNIETRGIIKPHQLSSTSDDLIHAKPYQAANYYHLYKIFNFIKENFNGKYDNHNFYDFGCGKGRTLIIARKFFKQAYGVELCEKLVLKAVNNTSRDKNIFIHNASAANFVPRTKNNIYFLYNPFEGEVVEKFLLNLERNGIGKDDIFIYFNPRYPHPFLNRFKMIHKMSHPNLNRVVCFFKL